MTTTMKCFVAGTLVLTVNGLVAIETIKQGDIVYAANADTFIVSPRKVLETFQHQHTFQQTQQHQHQQLVY